MCNWYSLSCPPNGVFPAFLCLQGENIDDVIRGASVHRFLCFHTPFPSPCRRLCHWRRRAPPLSAMRLLTGPLPPSLLTLILTLLLRCATPVYADPATVPFTDCFDNEANQTQKLNISTVYAQVLENNDLGKYLNLTMLGQSPQQILGVTNASRSLC